MRVEYVCGFMFSNDYKRVLLIKKKRPDWQAGKWNGIGGHIERGCGQSECGCLEHPTVAMAREFKEETGVETIAPEWRRFATFVSDQATVYFLMARSTHAVEHARTITDENVAVWSVDEIFSDWKYETLLPNICTLIGHAIGHAFSGFGLKPLLLSE